MKQRCVLVTGGLGFIGSHIAVLLLQHHYDVVLFDNLSNSHRNVVDSIAQISGQQPVFVQGDTRDRNVLQQLFSQYQVDAVIHCAGLKAVGESVQKPLLYYDNNVNGTVCLLHSMEQAGVRTLVFSSSATVYGDPQQLPIPESHPLNPINPYGHTKLMGERLLQDWHQSQHQAAIACLRYFNPVSAHPSGLLGENPRGIPNNLMPYIMQVASGQRDRLSVFGNDYPTLDGTGVRDYLHVMDLASGHLAALDYLLQHPHELIHINLGTGTGYSVLDLIHTVEQVTGTKLPYEIVDRRPGDIAASYANPNLARQRLNWQAQNDLYTMCLDAWNWVKHNAT